MVSSRYDDAKAENPNIKTVVVTGGGNDILQDPAGLLDCPALGDLCKGIIDMVGAAFLELADEMAADGVEDVIIINYSRNTLLGAEPIEYAYDSIAPLCDDANYDLLGEHILRADGHRGHAPLAV